MRAPVVEAARQAQIDMMDRGDRHSFEDVLTAMLMPIIHVFSARVRMLYARFMMRLLPLDEDEQPYFKALHLYGPYVEIQRQLLYCLPVPPSDVHNTRVRIAVSRFLQGHSDSSAERRV